MFDMDFSHEHRGFDARQDRQRNPRETGILLLHVQSGAGASTGDTTLDELPGGHSRDMGGLQSTIGAVGAIIDGTGQSVSLENQLGSPFEPLRILHHQPNQFSPHSGGWSQSHPRHAHETPSDSAYYTSSERRPSTAFSVSSGHYHGMPSSVGALSSVTDPDPLWPHHSTSSRASVQDYDTSQNDAQARAYFERYSDIDLTRTHVPGTFSNQVQYPRDGPSEDHLGCIDPQIATQAQNPPGTNPATAQDNTTLAGSSGKQFRCIFKYAGCDSSFGRKQDWKKHLTSRHDLEHPAIYRCTRPGCNQPADYVFSRKDHLKEHLKKIHHLNHDTSFPEGDLEKKNEPRGVPDFLRCGFCTFQFREGGMSDWTKVLHHVSQHYAPNSTENWDPYPEFAEWAKKESMLAKIKPRRARR